MAVVYFPSLAQGEFVQVHFLRPDGGEVPLDLLVDSGFTGHSSFVLSDDALDLAHAPAPASQAAGALQGMQRRALVTCRIPGLSFQRAFIAIFADLSLLSLPSGIQGMAGLRFLRHFRRWGAERSEDGSWQFLLSDSAG